jgi:hypothetical protein
MENVSSKYVLELTQYQRKICRILEVQLQLSSIIPEHYKRAAVPMRPNFLYKTQQVECVRQTYSKTRM